MKLAILGATGQIGRCLALAYAARATTTLFARRSAAATEFAGANGLNVSVYSYDALPDGDFDVIINAVGNGIPGDIRRAGADILDVTARYDRLCLNYLKAHPGCAYIFLSTGAIYGPDYAQAQVPAPVLPVPLNQPAPALYYPLAKRLAEMAHRDTPDLAIADIRIFGFVSPQMDLDSDFLIAQILNAARRRNVFDTRPGDVVRDYIGPDDLTGLIDALIARNVPNGAYDILSSRPTSKFRILEALATRGLAYTVDGTARKGEHAPLPDRLSHLRTTENVGFFPACTSLDNVLRMAENQNQSPAGIQDIKAI